MPRRRLTPQLERYLGCFNEYVDAQRDGGRHAIDVARDRMLSALDEVDFTETDRPPSYSGPFRFRR